MRYNAIGSKYLFSGCLVKRFYLLGRKEHAYEQYSGDAYHRPKNAMGKIEKMVPRFVAAAGTGGPVSDPAGGGDSVSVRADVRRAYRLQELQTQEGRLGQLMAESVV